MTNLEWMFSEKKDLLIECLSNGINFGVDENGNADTCRNMKCSECIFRGKCVGGAKEWLNAERNPYSIPLNTPIDTPMLVRDSNYSEWYKRYFAGFDESSEHPYKCFADGKTSWTTNGATTWKYCKLASEEEKRGRRMNSTERFFDIRKDNVLGNKDDLVIGLSQLEEEIRADEREKIKKFAEDYIKEHYFPNSRASEIVKYFVEGVVEEYGKVVEE